MKGMIFVPEIIENFYGYNLYTFTNATCSCKEDIIYEAPYAEPHCPLPGKIDTKKHTKVE